MLRKLLLIIAPLPLILLMAPAATAESVDNTTLFKFATHGTYMNFSASITSDRIVVNAENASFTNVQMSGSSYTSSLIVGVENADMTIRALENENIEFDLIASSGIKSLAKLTDGGRGKPKRVKANNANVLERDSLSALLAANNGWYWSNGAIYVRVTHSSTENILVDWGNRPPTGSITSPSSGSSTTVGSVVQFTSSASDPDGDSLSFSWDFGGEGASSEQNPTHRFREIRFYSVALTVSDSFSSDSDTITLNVVDISTKPDITLVFYVTDNENNPIMGAKITIDDTIQKEVFTDIDGMVLVQTHEGRYGFTVEKSGYKSAELGAKRYYSSTQIVFRLEKLVTMEPDRANLYILGFFFVILLILSVFTFVKGQPILALICLSLLLLVGISILMNGGG